MLYETLVGQRRILREQEEFLNQHQFVLMRRQGNPVPPQEDKVIIDLGPVLNQVDGLRQQKVDELHKLEREIEQMRSSIEQAQMIIDSQSREQESKHQELLSMEQNLLSLRTATSECRGRVNLYQEALQPIQDCLDGIRQQLEAMTSALEQVQESSEHQFQAIAQMRQTLMSLMANPQLAV